MATQPVRTSRPKKTKRPDKRPARARYWNSGRLALHKVRNMVKCSGMDPLEALELWESTRKRNKGTIPYSKIKKLKG